MLESAVNTVIVAGQAVTVWFIAQDAADGGFESILEKWGFPIALVLALMVGRFVPGFLHDRVWKASLEKDAEIKRLTDTTIEKVLPAVLESNRVLAEVAEVLKDLRDDRRRKPRQ